MLRSVTSVLGSFGTKPWTWQQVCAHCPPVCGIDRLLVALQELQQVALGDLVALRMERTDRACWPAKVCAASAAGRAWRPCSPVNAGPMPVACSGRVQARRPSTAWLHTAILARAKSWLAAATLQGAGRLQLPSQQTHTGSSGSPGAVGLCGDARKKALAGVPTQPHRTTHPRLQPGAVSHLPHLCNDARVHALADVALRLLHQLPNQHHHRGGAVAAGGRQPMRAVSGACAVQGKSAPQGCGMVPSAAAMWQL